eukprot:11700_1
MPVQVPLSTVMGTVVGALLFPERQSKESNVLSWVKRKKNIAYLISEFENRYADILDVGTIDVNLPKRNTSVSWTGPHKTRKLEKEHARNRIKWMLEIIDPIVASLDCEWKDAIAHVLPHIVTNYTDIDRRIVPIMLVPSLPADHKCWSHQKALVQNNDSDRPYMLRIAHTMTGGYVAVCLRYSCCNPAKDGRCHFEYGRVIEDGLPFWDFTMLRDNTFEYFLTSNRQVWSKAFMIYSLSSWMCGTPFDTQRTIWNAAFYDTNRQREELWNLDKQSIGRAKASLTVNPDRLREAFHAYTLAKFYAIRGEYIDWGTEKRGKGQTFGNLIDLCCRRVRQIVRSEPCNELF